MELTTLKLLIVGGVLAIAAVTLLLSLGIQRLGEGRSRGRSRS
jgi:hypothetical protein